MIEQKRFLSTVFLRSEFKLENTYYGVNLCRKNVCGDVYLRIAGKTAKIGTRKNFVPHDRQCVHSVCTLRLHLPCPSPKPFIFCIIFFWYLVLGTLCPHSPSSVSVPSIHLLSNKTIARKLYSSVGQCFKVLTKLLTPADKHRYLLSYKRHSLLSKKTLFQFRLTRKQRKFQE